MDILSIILVTIAFYLFQVWICSIIHVWIGSRIPKNIFWDLIKLTFLPYIIFVLITDKNKLLEEEKTK